MLLKQMYDAIGIPESFFDELDNRKYSERFVESRLRRTDLTVEEVPTTAYIDSFLPVALETLKGIVSREFLHQPSNNHCRLTEIETDEPISLVRGIRVKSDFPLVHRFYQALNVAQDYLDGHPLYDHFGGAILVP